MNNLAIIPARGGSKRIPGKNIKPFLGKPIIAYPLAQATESGLFQEVMVSTDSQEIATIAQSYGAKVPFYRSEKNANDKAPLYLVIEEVLHQYKTRFDWEFDHVCCILPTAVLLKKEHLVQALSLITQMDFDSVRPVVRFSYPIQKAFKIEHHKAAFFYPDQYTKRTQDLEPAYHDAGMFYMIKKNRKLTSTNRGAFEIDEMQAQDIDNESDWKMAELKYKMLLSHG
ncbi:MAG: pseudaminic acid cytidylyltransferase [Candidatus Cyclobacteriaceae bacterium M3_2C_046]